ncbi:MAG: retropepsin-like aspartic protease [Flavobacteriales bacterium]
MKKLFSFALLSIITSIAWSQAIYSKDNIYIGEKSEFMSECVAGAASEEYEMEGIKFQKEAYCSCICDNLLPEVIYADLERAMMDDDMMDFLTSGDNLNILLQCLEGNYEIASDFTYSTETIDDEAFEASVLVCKEEILKDPEAAAVFDEASAERFCICAMETLVENGYTYEEMLQAENEDSEAFNEIIIPCMVSVLADNMNYTEDLAMDFYNPDDIIGDLRSTHAPLLDYLGKGYKLKLDINGVSKYFLLDTGASDLLITADVEQELLKNGTITEASYTGETEYTLANGDVVIGKNIILNAITIGEYVVNNVEAAIIPSGTLLCGNSFLNKFSHWEIDQKNKELILYK